jgi:hypothetical protein
MAGETIRGATIVQWAAESTKGTDLACTSKVILEEFGAAPDDQMYRPRFLNGVLLQNIGSEQAITRGSTFKVSGPLSHAQLPHWMEMVIQGAVTPTGGPTYTWTHTRNATAIPTIDSFTFERRLSDTSTNIDQAWHYCMCRSLTIKGEPRGIVMFEADMFGRRIQSEAITGALSIPATPDLVNHGTSAVYIDSTWANRGTTVIAAQLLDWSLTIKPGFMPFYTADGRSDLDFPTHVLNSDEVGLEFTAKMLIPGTSPQYSTEKTAAAAGTLRAVELRMTGSSPNVAKIQFLAKHETPDIYEIGTQDGQNVVELKMVGSTDATNYMAAVLVNQVATDA